jgi:hypothetical protein
MMSQTIEAIVDEVWWVDFDPSVGGEIRQNQTGGNSQ